jgi:hypothetical protein
MHVVEDINLGAVVRAARERIRILKATVKN